MANHTGSAIVSMLIAVMLIGTGQVMKNELSSTRVGTLTAGFLGSLVFIFLLTAMSNLQMASVGDHVKCGLTEVTVCMVVALIVSATIHRVAITVCLLFSIFFVFLLAGISQTRYTVQVVQPIVQGKRKK